MAKNIDFWQQKKNTHHLIVTKNVSLLFLLVCMYMKNSVRNSEKLAVGSWKNWEKQVSGIERNLGSYFDYFYEKTRTIRDL